MKSLEKLLLPVALMSISGCAINYSTLDNNEKVGAGCTRNITFNYEIVSKNPNKKIIKKILYLSEHIPDSLQEKFNNSGGKIIIFDDKLTDLNGFKYLKGRICPNGKLWDNVDGAYSPITNSIAINQNNKYINVIHSNIVLHEITHGIVWTVLNNEKWYTNSSVKLKEMVANMGAEYYYSNYTRETLKIYNKNMYKFFKTMGNEYTKNSLDTEFNCLKNILH